MLEFLLILGIVAMYSILLYAFLKLDDHISKKLKH